MKNLLMISLLMFCFPVFADVAFSISINPNRPYYGVPYYGGIPMYVQPIPRNYGYGSSVQIYSEQYRNGNAWQADKRYNNRYGGFKGYNGGYYGNQHHEEYREKRYHRHHD